MCSRLMILVNFTKVNVQKLECSDSDVIMCQTMEPKTTNHFISMNYYYIHETILIPLRSDKIRD